MRFKWFWKSIAIISMSGLQIRDARASDRDAIEAVTLSAFQEYAASKSNRWEDYRQGIFAALATVQPATQIVAEQNSEIIGSVLLYPKGTVIAIPGSAPISNLEFLGFIVFAVEYEFHETSHLFARAAARGFTVEQAIGAVKAPSSVMRNPQNKGNHGGLIRLFFRAYGDKVLVVVAEIKGHECWIITGYWAIP